MTALLWLSGGFVLGGLSILALVRLCDWVAYGDERRRR